MYIHSNDKSASADPNQPKSSRQRRPVHESTWPHTLDQCHIEAAARPSWAGRTQFSLGTARLSSSQRKEGPAAPLPQTRLSPSWGPETVCFALLACLLAGWYEINTFTWPTMTRSPAALRNLVKLERRRGVALVIARRARNPRRRPIAGNTTSKPAAAAEPSPGSGKRQKAGLAAIGAAASCCQAAEPRWHCVAMWERFLGLR